MPRGDKHDKKKLARAWDDLKRGLARNDVDLAIAAIARIPREERLEQTALLGGRVVEEVERARSARAWPRLHTLVVRLEEARDLLEDCAPATLWPLVCGAALSGDWPRAQRLWLPLRRDAESRAPRFVAVVDGWLDHRGRIEHDLPAMPQPEDDRLGFELVRPRKAIPFPSTPDAARDALFEARTSMGWDAFAAAVREWIGRASPAVALTLGEEGAALAVYETLRRMDANDESALAPLALVETCRAYARQEDALLAFRICLSSIVRGPSAPRSASTLLAGLVRCATVDATTHALLRRAVVGAATNGGRRASLLPALEALHAKEADPAVWATGVVAVMERARADADTPAGSTRLRAASWAWLDEARAKHAQPRSGLSDWIRGADDVAARVLIAFLSDAPGDLVASSIEALWDDVSEPHRRLLAASAARWLSRADGSWCESCATVHPGDLTEYEDLPAPAQRFWDRVEERLLRYDSSFLFLAITRAKDARARADVVDRYLEGDAPIDRWLDVLEIPGPPQGPRAAPRRDGSRAGGYMLERIAARSARERMMARFEGDAISLARGVIRVSRRAGKAAVLAALSTALLSLASSRDTSARAIVLDALPIARRHARKAAPRAAATGRSGTSPRRVLGPSKDPKGTTTARPATTGNGDPAQLTLPGGSHE